LLLLLKAFSFAFIATVLFHVADADATALQQLVGCCFYISSIKRKFVETKVAYL